MLTSLSRQSNKKIVRNSLYRIGISDSLYSDIDRTIRDGLNMENVKETETEKLGLLESITRSIREPSYSHNLVHVTMEDFQRTRKRVPVIVCIGACGAGKSTLLNRMCGLRLVQGGHPDYSIMWNDHRGKIVLPYFVSGVSSSSVTSQVSFINTYIGGDETKPVILVDTPGHDIPELEQLDRSSSRDALQLLAADFHDKLKAIGRINCLLVLHNDVISNRLNSATFAMLQMIQEKFSNMGDCGVDAGNAVDKPIWDNVIIAYSKCNANTDSWKNELDLKFSQLRHEIQTKVVCGPVENLTITTVGGLGDDDSDIARIYDIASSMEAIDTRNLMPFNASFAKYESLIREKNELEARYHAMRTYPSVVLRFVVLFFALSLRSHVPYPLNLLLLDFPGPYDEMLACGMMCHSIGFQNVAYSLEYIASMAIEGPKLTPESSKKA